MSEEENILKLLEKLREEGLSCIYTGYGNFGVNLDCVEEIVRVKEDGWYICVRRGEYEKLVVELYELSKMLGRTIILLYICEVKKPLNKEKIIKLAKSLIPKNEKIVKVIDLLNQNTICR